jgi:hypothetical protein
MQLPFEKNIIRFYKYYFEGIEKPLIIEAKNKDDSWQFLVSEINKRPYLHDINLINQTITTPIFGVTKKEEKGVEYIWCGFENSDTGWMSKVEFSKLPKDKYFKINNE